MKEAEKAVLSERVCSLQTELSTAVLELERNNRDMILLKDQQRVRITQTHKHHVYLPFSFVFY